MARVSIYLIFTRTTEEAFTFYQSVFGGILSTIMRLGDAPETMGFSITQGNNVHINLEPDTRKETRWLLRQLHGQVWNKLDVQLS